MVMFQFTEENVIKFCEVTEDSSIHHKPDAMKEKGKLAIVPGMYILALAASQAERFFQNQNTKAEVYFGAPTSVGDSVNFDVAGRENGGNPNKGEPEIAGPQNDVGQNPAIELKVNEIARLLTESNGIDVLCAPKQEVDSQDVRYTRLLNIGEMPPEIEGYKRILIPKDDFLGRFAKLINREPDNLTELLFAIAYSSRALLRGVGEPVTDVEKVARNAMGKLIPVYTSLDLFIPNERPRIEVKGGIHYTVRIENIAKKKFTYTLDCHTEKGRLCHAVYRLRATKERFVLEMAKDIPKPSPNT